MNNIIMDSKDFEQNKENEIESQEEEKSFASWKAAIWFDPDLETPKKKNN